MGPVSQLSLNEVTTTLIVYFPAVTFDKKESAAGKSRIRKVRVSPDPPPLKHHYLDELAVGSVRRRKFAAADREIDLLLPFGVAGKMPRDVPNFDGAQGEERGVGNELVPCSCRSVPDGNDELSAK